MRLYINNVFFLYRLIKLIELLILSIHFERSRSRMVSNKASKRFFKVDWKNWLPPWFSATFLFLFPPLYIYIRNEELNQSPIRAGTKMKETGERTDSGLFLRLFISRENGFRLRRCIGGSEDGTGSRGDEERRENKHRGQVVNYGHRL